MNILITGAAGFIGGHLMTTLRRAGHDVHGIDRRFGAEFQGDLLEPYVAQDVVDHLRPEIVVHLAAQVGRLFGEDDMRHTIESNATMTTYVANACRRVGARMVYSSTSEVYGDNGNEECHEYSGPFSRPHNLYGLSKFWGEDICELYCPTELKILRLSMPYGTGVVPGRGRAALPNMIWQAATGQPITVHRGARRSWCWVGDTVEAIRLIIESDEAGPYNVGRDDAEVTMLECARRACDVAGGDWRQIEEVDPPGAQTVVKRLNTTRARSLPWSPTVDLSEGMNRIYDWVRQFDAEGRYVQGGAG